MPAPTQGTRLHIFDARPILAAGDHPLQDVLAWTGRLAPVGVLEVVTPFEPRPLVRLLRERGLQVEVCGPASPGGPAAPEACAPGQACPPPPSSWTQAAWVLRVSPSLLPVLEELVELEAPGPLERVLEACARLAPGGVYMAHLPRHPALLLPQLEARGLEWDSARRPDGTAVLWVRRAP